jgi:tyrosine decarboxylase/aspartate 1-decarboxylase
MLGKKTLPILAKSLEKLESGFADLPEFDYEENLDLEKIQNIMMDIAEKMKNNYPYYHPQYAGQMLKPPHPIASLAYSLAMWVNPNNHAMDGGRESTNMEKLAVDKIAKMFGYSTYLGHLCGGGTIANMEALWISSLLGKNKYIVASEQAHYTHERICSVLKIPFKKIKCDNKGKMSLEHLEAILMSHEVGTVVVTLGTTALGSVDPLEGVFRLREKYNFRVHVDAAYGGYFILVDNLLNTVRQSFDLLSKVDSIVVDPHKHGLQPYGCGCVLFSDPSVGTFYKHDSPYTYFTSKDLHLGEISLECSRSGSTAVALFATLELLPLVKKGEFANNLSKSISAATKLYSFLKKDDKFLVPVVPELDIVIWTLKGKTPDISGQLVKKLFNQLASKGLHLAVVELPMSLFHENDWKDKKNINSFVTCLRSCLIKPQHYDQIDMIYSLIKMAAEELVLTENNSIPL